MTDQPRDPKQVPPDAGAEQPTVAQPTAQAGAAEQPTTQAEPVAPTQPEAAPAAAAQGPPAPDQTAVHGQQAPPTPQLSQPGPGQAYGAWGPPPASTRPGGFRRFVGHRATQLVGVGLLGVLVGGGIVGGIAAATHHGPRDGRPGIHRQHNGPNPGFDGRGPGLGGHGHGNSGKSGNPGSGDGG
ncbi:hypothetical protein [Amycolatopsis sp. NPDC051128]|uniref:hypothetical protein n=1 Tax=Amycolatopsis sp. NPDC051128 TaxID=3155412 RepID=UPI00344496CD